MFTMPGIPILYYGSEWGLDGNKADGDPALRPYVRKPEWNGLTDLIQMLADLRHQEPALSYGDFRSVALTNQAAAFARTYQGEKILVALNESGQEQRLHFQEGHAATDLITKEELPMADGINLPPYGVRILKYYLDS